MLTDSQENIKDAIRSLMATLPPVERKDFLDDLRTIGDSQNNWRRDVQSAINSLEDAYNS